MKVKKKNLHSKNNKDKITTGPIIHIKLDYDESLQGKRDLLSSKINLIEIMKAIKKYHFFRIEELKIKIKLDKKIKGMNTNIKKLQKTLPKVKIPQILKPNEIVHEKEVTEDHENKEIKRKIKETREIDHDEGLETELQEIQNKLNSLAKTNNF